MSGMFTKRKLRNSNRRWQRKMLPMQVRSLEQIAHDLANKAERLVITSMVQWAAILVLMLVVIYLLEVR